MGKQQGGELRIYAGKCSVGMSLSSKHTPVLVTGGFEGTFRLVARMAGSGPLSVDAEMLEGTYDLLSTRIEITFYGVWDCGWTPSEHIMDTDRYFEHMVEGRFKRASVFEKMASYLLLQNVRHSGSAVYVRDIRDGKILREKMYKSTEFFVSHLCGERLIDSYIYCQMLKHMSHLVGSMFDKPSSARMIPRFVEFFGIDTSELRKEPRDFRSFNEFFCRELRENSRVVDDLEGMSSPADCRLTVFRCEQEAKEMWIKGMGFGVVKLTGKDTEAGFIGLCRLAPMDYHRFHAPFECTVEDIREIDGKHLTVHPGCVRRSDVLTENKRVVVSLGSPTYGRVYLVLVGALFVGSIVVNRQVGERLKVLDEIGYFRFGGSSIVIVTERKVVPRRSIYLNTVAGVETVVKVGNWIGRLDDKETHPCTLSTMSWVCE